MDRQTLLSSVVRFNLEMLNLKKKISLINSHLKTWFVIGCCELETIMWYE